MSAFTEDQREEFADAALAAERRNRSRGLVVLGVVAMVIGLSALGWAWSVRSGAASELDRERSRLERVRSLAVGFEAMERRAADGRLAVQRRDPRMFSTIKQAAVEAGLENAPEIPNRDPQTTRDGGVTERRIEYNNVRSDSIGPLIEWVDLACHRVPGLTVYEIVLEPRGQQWFLSVTFIRWEREEPGA